MRDQTGAVQVEYVVLLAVVALVGSAAIVAVGQPLFEAFRFAQLLLTLPIP